MVAYDGQRETGIYPATIGQNGARATLPVIATLFGAGKTEMNTQGIEQRSPGARVSFLATPLTSSVIGIFAGS